MVHNLTDFFSNYNKISAINLHYLKKHAACSKLETLVHLQSRPWSRSPQWSCCRCSSPELSCDTAAVSDERLDSCKHLRSDHKTLNTSCVALACMQGPLHWVHRLINANVLGLIFTITENSPGQYMVTGV